MTVIAELQTDKLWILSSLSQYCQCTYPLRGNVFLYYFKSELLYRDVLSTKKFFVEARKKCYSFKIVEQSLQVPFVT